MAELHLSPRPLQNLVVVGELDSASWTSAAAQLRASPPQTLPSALTHPWLPWGSGHSLLQRESHRRRPSLLSVVVSLATEFQGGERELKGCPVYCNPYRVAIVEALRSAGCACCASCAVLRLLCCAAIKASSTSPRSVPSSWRSFYESGLPTLSCIAWCKCARRAARHEEAWSNPARVTVLGSCTARGDPAESTACPLGLSSRPLSHPLFAPRAFTPPASG